MTPAQTSVFSAATGHTPSGVSTMIASILTVLLFMWATWIVIRVLSAMQKGDSRQIDLLWAGLRSSALIWVALYIVQPD